MPPRIPITRRLRPGDTSSCIGDALAQTAANLAAVCADTTANNPVGIQVVQDGSALAADAVISRGVFRTVRGAGDYGCGSLR